MPNHRRRSRAKSAAYSGNPKRDLRPVLFLCSSLHEGGAERHWASLLPALATGGVALRLVSIGPGGRSFKLLSSGGIPTRTLGLGGLRTALALPPLIGELLFGRPGKIVSWGYSAYLLGTLLALSFGIEHIVHWHGGPGLKVPPRRRQMLRCAARAGSAAIAVSQAQIDDLIQVGFPPERVTVIANGVAPPPPALLATPVVDLRRRLGLPGSALIALTVARLEPEKALADFITVVTRAARLHPGLRGVIVGDGDERRRLERHSAQIGAPVNFVGYQERPLEWIRAADIVCLTSSSEALPMVILEAMACARPVLATAVGGVPTVVVDGVTGHLTAPHEIETMTAKLLDLAADEPARARLAAAGQARWREHFSQRPMIDAYITRLTEAGRSAS